MHGVLHGTWITESPLSGNFIVWVEIVPDIQKFTPKAKKRVRSRKKNVRPFIHPYSAHENNLIKIIDDLFAHVDQSELFYKNKSISKLELLFPTSNDIPIPSPELIGLAKWSQDIEITFDISQAKPEWWVLPVLSLSIMESYHFFPLLKSSLSDIKHLIRLGQDIQYWLQVFAFLEDLIQLQSFLPTIWIDETKKISSYWRVVPQCQELRSYWNELLQQMPNVCRCYRDPKNPTFLVPSDELVQSFLDTFFQLEINNKLNPDLIKEVLKFPRTGKRRPKALAKICLATLHTPSNETLNSDDLEIFHSLRNYIDKGISSLDSSRQEISSQVYFQLEPPDIDTSVPEIPDPQKAPWILSFWLQSRDDPSLRIPARYIWKEKGRQISYLNRQFTNPQEVLLEGLGRAMKIFPPIRRSLKTKNPESCLLTFSEAITFLQETTYSLNLAGFGVMIPRGSAKSAIKRPSVNVSISPISKGIVSSARILNFQWKIAIGDEVLTEDEINLLATLKTPLINLRGKWVEVNPIEIKKTLNYWKKISENNTLPVSEVIRLAANPTNPNLGLPIQKVSLPEWFEKLLTDRKDFTLLAPPANLNAELRPYQLRGVSWISFMHSLGLNPCLADDMGLGKTIQAIAVILLLKANFQSQIPQTSQKKGRQKKRVSEKSLRIFIICPTSVITNWGEELSNFAPTLRWKAYHGSNREEILEEKLDVIITSYGLVRRDQERLKNQHWDLLIIDESQNIKNPYSGQSKAVRSLNATFKIAMTGTPIENRLTELWSLFDFLSPNYLGSFKHFQQHYARSIELYEDERVTQQLVQVVKPFLLRRIKQDKQIISDLPDKFETKEYCNLTKEQITLYQSIVKQQLQVVESAEGISRRGAILATLLKLKQICNHPSHLLGGQGKIEGRSGKLQRVWELIDEIVKVGDAVLIFTQFVQMGEILKKFLQNRLRQEVLFLHGRKTRKQRDRIIKEFQESENTPQIMILSLKAGGTGLNLTRANHVIHYDRWWNPAVENQATDRAYRIGQKRNVQVHKMITLGTIEEHIDELIERKTTLAKTFAGSGEEALTSLSNEEFHNLITLSQTMQFLDEDY